MFLQGIVNNLAQFLVGFGLKDIWALFSFFFFFLSFFFCFTTPLNNSLQQLPQKVWLISHRWMHRVAGECQDGHHSSLRLNGLGDSLANRHSFVTGLRRNTRIKYGCCFSSTLGPSKILWCDSIWYVYIVKHLSKSRFRRIENLNTYHGLSAYIYNAPAGHFEADGALSVYEGLC